jgi:hypothetical protein
MRTTIRSFLAAVAAFAAFGLPAAHAQLPGAGISFPAITKVERKLNLTPAQKVQFDIALEASKSSFVAVEANHKELKQLADLELAKTRPDLEMLANELDESMEQIRVEKAKVRAEWLKLYAMLSDDQVAIVKAALKEKIALMAWVREFVVKWFVTRRD